MSFARAALLLFTSLVIPAIVNGQQVPTTATASRDPQSVILLQRSLAALVGTGTVKDVTLSGNARRIAGSDDETGTTILKATAIGQGRIDLTSPGGQRSEMADISQSPPIGSWCGSDGAWHSIATHNLSTDPTWFFPAFLINRVLSGANYAISPSDSETQAGIAVEHVTIYRQPGFTGKTAALLQNLSQIDIYFDASTLRPAAISFDAHPDDDALTNIPVQIRFSNYQSLQGLSVSYHIQKYIQSGLVLDIAVTTVQVNSGIPATDFQVQ